MNIEITMSDATPGAVRAQGDIRIRGKQDDLEEDVRVRVGSPGACALPTGQYTYVFGIDRKGTFTLAAVNAATGAELKSKTYTDALTSDELRFKFEVP